MKTSSAKAKGRKLQDETRELLLRFFSLLNEGDIKTAVMGESGRDIIFSPLAEEDIPFDIECKYQEKTSIWSWMKQAEQNAGEDRIPLVVFRRNRSEIYCTLKFEDLLKL